MLKTTVLEGKQILVKELNFEEFSNLLEEYFLLNDVSVTDINIRTEIPNMTNQGIAATFNNHVKIEGLYKCFNKLANGIILEFKEYAQSIFIGDNANITLDFMFNRLYIKDFNICIYFGKHKRRV